jgi:hypothetical protein
MTSHRLVGVTLAEDAPRLCAAAPSAGLVCVEGDGLAALLAPARRPMAAWLQTRKAAMGDVLGFQKLLEALSAAGPVLPASHGSALVAPTDAAALLSAHSKALRRDLADYGARVQFQVEVRWEPTKAMAALKADGRMAGLNVALAHCDRQAFGVALQAFMESEKMRLAAEFQGRLSDVAREIVGLPLADDAAILNVAALIERSDERLLDKAVEAIDAAMPEALAIRYLGPLPAVSFASIVIAEQDKGALGLSQKRLGIGKGATAAETTAAYRNAMRQVHPDVAGALASADATADLAAAYAVALKAAAAPRTARGAPLLLDIRREGEGQTRGAA